MTFSSPKKESVTRIRQEALELSHKAIKSCPNRPAGYLSLSRVSDSYIERLQSLQSAIKFWTQECPLPRTRLIHALVRLLVEPRQEEKRKDCKGKTHLQNRRLDDNEQKIYEKIQSELHHVRTRLDSHFTKESNLLLGRLEYRL
jgi:hypothetical protein